MTVKELIEKLKEFPENQEVFCEQRDVETWGDGDENYVYDYEPIDKVEIIHDRLTITHKEVF